MPNFDFKGDQAKADNFQPKIDAWVDHLKEFKDVLKMEPEKIIDMYHKVSTFKQWIVFMRKVEPWFEAVREKVKNAV